LLLLSCPAFALDASKYYGGSYDGHVQVTSASGLILGELSAYKYYGGSYDGHVQGTSASGLTLGLWSAIKYYGGSYDGHVQGTSASGLTLGLWSAIKYYGGSYDGHVQSGMSNSLVQVKLFLEGPYNTSTNQMNNTISVPTTSPYSEDARTIASIPADIVDWVLLQMRLASNGFTVTSQSALLHEDGRIVADDGTTSAVSNGGGTGDRYIVVRHRNHLAVMSAAALTLSASSSVLYDFSTGLSQYYGTDANRAKQVKTGIYGMNSGDANGSGTVDASDRSSTWNGRNQSGYLNADCNLSGTVDASDRSITWNNRNMSTSVP